MKKFLMLIGIIVVIVGGWLIVSKTEQKQTPQSTNNIVTAPDFHLQDYNGKNVSLADFAGKPLVINSWAAWCPFCKKELLDFAAAQKEFSARGGSAFGGGDVTIIAINRAEPLETAKKYSDEIGVTNNLIFLLDPADSFYQSIGGFSMPETIFVDGSGNIKIHKRGPMDIEEIRQEIQSFLQS
ncbi:TlpA family protein disulfide reductase [Candidatus Wolfebacteria bacterium]|nr:TlpA family protein disulfide reductase [Candidatus Wolfebacteria bacterium]